MADIQTRLFSKDYRFSLFPQSSVYVKLTFATVSTSGLVNQSVITIVVAVISVTSHEILKRRRRGLHIQPEGLGSVESWEFG